MKVVKAINSRVVNYPMVVSGAIVCLVIVHFLASRALPAINVAAALANTKAQDPRDLLTSLALGVASVSAMVGGFAGVVVIFGLGTESDRFRLLRTKGDKRLRANWISVVLSSFVGAFGSVVAAVIVVAYSAELGMWVLEACLLFTGHGAVRLTALLAGLAGIVDADDKQQARRKRDDEVPPSSQLIPESGRRLE